MPFTIARRAVLATSLAIAGAAVVPRPAAAEWRRIDTPNFIVVGDASARDLGRIAAQFESFRETLGRVLSERVTASPVPTVVVVFPNAKAFQPFQRVYEGKPVDVAGAFHGDRDFNYITILNDGRPGGMRIVFHEYAHLVVGNISMNLPTWLNEGLAEYYSTFEIERDGREATIGRPIEGHLRVLARLPALPVEQLIRVDRSSSLYNEGDRRSVFYAQSWALAHMLLLGEPSRSVELAEYLRHVNAGVPELDAWQRAFGGIRVERELQLYLRRETFRMTRYKFAEKLTTLDATSVLMAAPDVQALLASLYLRQRRYDDADRLAAAVLKEQPDHPLANVIAARVELERGDLVAAMARLVDFDPGDDWFVAYCAGTTLADLVSRTDGPATERVDAARRQFAAALKHHELANVHAHLALLELASPFGEPSRAGASIARARELAPGRDDYALVDARVLAELGDFDAARRQFEALMAPGFPSQIRNTARDWMANVGRMEASQRRGVSRTTAGFRARKPGEERIEGLLEGITCPAAAPAAFHLRTPTGLETLFAPELGAVQFITYRRDVTGKVLCGPLKDPLPVFVTWKAGAASMRIVVAVEFLPQR
jgi:tetratricopeptide (TPR) repeat protein